MKALQVVGLALIVFGVLTIGIGVALRSDEPSIVPLLVVATGAFDIIVGTVLFFVGKRAPNLPIKPPAEGYRERTGRP